MRKIILILLFYSTCFSQYYIPYGTNQGVTEGFSNRAFTTQYVKDGLIILLDTGSMNVDGSWTNRVNNSVFTGSSLPDIDGTWLSFADGDTLIGTAPALTNKLTVITVLMRKTAGNLYFLKNGTNYLMVGNSGYFALGRNGGLQTSYSFFLTADSTRVLVTTFDGTYWSVESNELSQLNSQSKPYPPVKFYKTDAGNFNSSTEWRIGNNWTGKIKLLMVYNRVLTREEINQNITLLSSYKYYPSIPDYTKLILCCGDSYTSELRGYYTGFKALFGSARNVIDGGYSGRQAISIQAMWANYFASIYNPYLGADSNILIFMGGSNDLWIGQTVADTYTAIKTACLTAKTAGWKVIVSTVIYRGDYRKNANFDVNYIALNDSITNHYSTFANDLYDPASNPLLQSYNTTYYTTDSIHLSTSGNSEFTDGLDSIFILNNWK